MNKTIPADFHDLKARVFDMLELDCTKPEIEQESLEYGACTFDLGRLKILFRVAKVTPTKIGQFVTLWKRIGKGPIQPFDDSDPIDFAVVCTRFGARFGAFIFPQEALVAKAVFSQKSKSGKRAIRVYPPWDLTKSRQAQQTQRWQNEYFLDLSHSEALDLGRVHVLFSLKK